MSESTHTLQAAEHDFAVRVYPASEPNGSVLVWLHGGATLSRMAEILGSFDTAQQLG